MNFRFKFTASSTWYTVDDYIIECDTVPLITREIDYTINTRGFSFSLTQKYDFPLAYTIDDLEKVFIAGNGDLAYLGVVKKVETIHANKTYNITVYNELESLNNYKVDILDGAALYSPDVNKYNPSDFYTRKVASLLHVFNVMFNTAGMNSPTNYISGRTAIKYKTMMYHDFNTVYYEDILFSELKIDVNMLNALGQNIAASKPVTDYHINRSAWDTGLTPTFLDVVNWFCSMFGLTIRYFADRYIFIDVDEYNYTVAQSDTYELAEDKTDVIKSVSFNIKGAAQLAYYDEYVDTQLSDFWWEKQAKNSNWINNLLVTNSIRKYDATAYEGSMFPPIIDLNYETSLRNFVNPNDVRQVTPTVVKIADKYRYSYENVVNTVDLKTYALATWGNVVSHDLNLELRESIISEVIT